MDIQKTNDVTSMKRGICLSSPFFTRHPAPKYLVTGDARRIEIEIGEVVEMACPGQLTYRWQLIRKPAGSAAHIEEARLKRVDKPGVYAIRVETGGGWSRYLELCAYTREQMFGDCTRKTDEQRLSHRGWLNDPATTTDDVVRRLEQ